ncbi:hypothetical protein RJ640_027305 [Escallonia rubra]|uniref:Retrovirus-related Pol polyprotein from transposon TNT 1-94 n=1 Tax=Escallonia rubra TaxID=112253 RepID=A0AA88S836_9ASTE|nr:hypothetical protein RJ640_027305 [Escallonia rubra]
MAEEGKGKIEKFNGMKFQWWKMQVEDYLYQKDLYLPLVGEKPEAMNASEWAILDRKALATVRLSLTPQVVFNISKEKTIAAVMKALEKLYEKPSASNKVFLMKKLFNMKMSENSSVVDHLNDFNGVTNKLESVVINFDDEIRALLFMCSLPDSWNNLVTTVSNSTISGTLTLNDVVSSVMNDEMRRKTIGDGISSSTALSVESRGRQNNKQNNRGRSPTRGRSKSRGKSKSKGRTIVCWNCNKEGHEKNDCTEPKKKNGAGGRQGDDEGANMVSSNKRAYDDLCLSATVDDNFKVWYVDSGASIHCTPHRDCFSDYVHGDYEHVTVGNGYRCNIVGKGKVKIKLSNGGTLILTDVRHIPELQKNLISVSGLDREGYFVAFGEKQWKVTKGSMVVARGERVGTLYTLSGTHNHSISLTFTENQRTTLWHHRLGHLSESGMKILHSKNALPGMKNIQLDFCEGCVYGKQKRVSFWKDGKERKTKRLELVHTDVCGPTTVKSLGDDASRKTWIYAIKQKSDVYHTFKKWKALVENEIGNKVKYLKSDNGGEYRDGGFQEYCSNNGIRLIRTVKRTPQENGLAERMNRTIMERARSPASALNGGIPKEEWSGKPVNYSFLRVFGCIAYAHIDKEEKKKLDSKSQKCVFIGYGGDEYGYRLWDYEHNKIIRSRDVIFNESRLYKHRLQEHVIEREDKEYMELDEPEDGRIPRIESPEVLDETTDTEIGAGDQQQVPETLNLRRSSRFWSQMKFDDLPVSHQQRHYSITCKGRNINFVTLQLKYRVNKAKKRI